MNRQTLKIRKNKLGMSDSAFNVLVTVLVTIIFLVILYPLIFVVSASFSSGTALSSGRVLLWPVDFSLEGYKMVLGYQDMWIGLGNSILYVVCGVTQNMFYTLTAAYVLSRKDFYPRNAITLFLAFTMWFSGGLIPTYMQYSYFGMVNSRLGYILMAGYGVSNVVIVRTYFQSSIPEELLEAAQMDGSSDTGYFLKIAIPLAKPMIAVQTLNYIVATWNAYMGPMIYLRDRMIKPLQLVLREVLAATQIDASSFSDPSLAEKMASIADVMKYSIIIVGCIPMLMIYPFIKKYFEKGMMIGSLKG